MANTRDHILLEYFRINEDSLRRVDTLIFCFTDAACWLFHDPDTWNAMVLVLPKKEVPIERTYFNRSKLVTKLKGEGLGDFKKISEYKRENTLEAFIRRPGTKLLNYTEEGQNYFDEKKGP